MNKSNYRFQLRKYKTGSKVICPDCGQKSFNLFIDTWGEIEFPQDVGWCDNVTCHSTHDHSPSRYFRENPDKRPKGYTGSTIHKYLSLPLKTADIKPKPLMFLPVEFMKRSLCRYDVNPLFNYLRMMVGEEETRRVFELYNVGTAKHSGGATVFWQLDINGNLRTGKIMKYGSDGHKVRLSNSNMVSWTHNYWREKPRGFQFTQCFFGEHLLPGSPDSKIMLVESEKSALVGTLFSPGYLWLASGGNNGCLNPEASRVLTGRKVLLVPDLKMEQEWTQKAEMLRSVGVNVDIFDMNLMNPTDEDSEKGLDIADFLLRAKPSKRESDYRFYEDFKRRWAQKYPESYAQYIKLCSALDLHLDSVRDMTDDEIEEYTRLHPDDSKP